MTDHSTAQEAHNTRNVDVAQHTPNISIDLAHAIGTDCANEWLDRGNNPVLPASSAVWRAWCLAEEVNDSRGQVDFLQLLAAWEQGFDSTLCRAAPTSAQDHALTIKRLAGQANTMAALLSVLHILPAPDQAGALRTCASMAQELAADLPALIGGAA